MTYTNELEVEVDFSDVDPALLEKADENNMEPVGAIASSITENTPSSDQDFDSPSSNVNLGLGTDKPKSNKLGTNEKFFKR